MAQGVNAQLLDKEKWKVEAESIIRDVKDHVKHICISKLESSNQSIYLNLTTVESVCHCVQVSSSGFTIVGHAYDENTERQGETFETPYALLDHISPNYRTMFANSLISKLSELESEQGAE